MRTRYRSETAFKEKVLKDLRAEGAWPEKIQQVSKRGTPDILCCWNGRFVALELKRDEKAKVAKLQLVKLEDIREAGGIAELVWPANWGEVLEEIRWTVSIQP